MQEQKRDALYTQKDVAIHKENPAAVGIEDGADFFASLRGSLFFSLRFWGILLGCLLFYYPVIANHIYYKDDLDRGLRAISNFKFAGRFAGDYLAHFLSGDFLIIGNAAFDLLRDTAPLFQLAALFFYAYAIYKALQIRSIPIDRISTLFALVIFIFNPFFIQNLLYRFDSLPMGVACSAAILAWALWEKNKRVAFLWLILVLCTYQTFLNLFIFLCIAEFCYRLVFEEGFYHHIKNLVIALVYALGALLFYRFLLVPIFARKASRSGLIGLNAQDLELLQLKVVNSFGFLTGYFTSTGKVLFYALLVLAIVEIMRNLAKQPIGIGAKFAKFAFVVIGFGSLAFLALGPFLILRDVAVQSRMFFVINLFSVAVIFLSLRLITRTSNKLAVVVGVLFAICPLAFSYFVNNALANQRAFEHHVVAQIDFDLNRLVQTKKPVYLGGYLPIAPLNALTIPRSYVGLEMAGPNPDWYLAMMLVARGHNNMKFGWDGSGSIMDEICRKDLKPAVSSRYYTLYEQGEHRLIWVGLPLNCAHKQKK